MAEAGAAELLTDERLDPVVLAEDEAAGERLLPGIEAVAEGGFGAAADPIERAGEAGAGGAGRSDPLRGELEGGTGAGELARTEVVGTAEGAVDLDPVADVDVGDRLGRGHDHPPLRRIELDAHLAEAAPRH